MYKLGERIRQIRKWRGLSQSDLEHKCGIKREYLSKLETSDLKNPTYSTLLKLSSALGISLTSLIDVVDKPIPQNPPAITVVSSKEDLGSLKNEVGSRYCAVPIIGEKLVANNPRYLVDQDIEDYALVPYDWLEEKSDLDRYRCMRLAEDNRSMDPVVCAGSIVCFDTGSCDPNTLHGQVVVLHDKQGRVLVRRLKREDGYLVAIPENIKEYELNIFSIGKENPVIGKVIWCIKQVATCIH